MVSTQWLSKAFLASGLLAVHAHETEGAQSLPKLLEINSLSDLNLNWDIQENVALDLGRLLIGPGSGSIWLRSALVGSDHEWTIEVMFRLTGISEEALPNADTNGLAFWLLADLDNSKQKYLGGPSVFDGYQFVLNNKDTRGFKLFANDLLKSLNGDLLASIGQCDFNYLDLTIPFTLRISYLKAQNWFKVQVDNNLCFKTDVLTIPNQPLKFGVSANAEGDKELFELLELKVWDKITEDAIDDHALMGTGDIVMKKDDKLTGDYNPSHNRMLLMERTRKHQEEIKQQLQDEQRSKGKSDYSLVIAESMSQFDDVNEKLQSLIYELKVIRTENSDAKREQEQVERLAKELREDFATIKESLSGQFSQLLSAVKQLNDKVIGEVREQHGGMEEIAKKVDLLMANHKEIAYQYLRDQAESPDISDVLFTRVKWILLPLIMVIIVLTVMLYRLRKDIKHGKLL